MYEYLGVTQTTDEKKIITDMICYFDLVFSRKAGINYGSHSVTIHDCSKHSDSHTVFKNPSVSP